MREIGSGSSGSPPERTALGVVTTVLRGDERHRDGVARVWAEAIAAREGVADVPPLEAARPVVAEVLDRPGAVLVVALGDDGQVAAFALAEPLPPAAGQEAQAAEVRYVGARPRLGRGVLRFLCAELAAARFLDAFLLVYADNTRASDLYERLGWRPEGMPVPHPRTGRPEQRYRLRLPG
ncbi:MAG: GNAT family N-acetyltransferase [Actinomadura sp.]